MANDKPCLHLPLDEIRIAGEISAAHHVGGVGNDALVRGNPKILHDPTMGTCLRCDGDGDYVELADLSSLTFAQGMTAMAWVRFEDTPYYSRIFDLNVAPNQTSNIIWAGNEGRSSHLAFEIDGIRFRVDNGVALRQWRHYAFVYEPAGNVSIIVDGALVFSKAIVFDIANREWQTGYVGKSSFTADSLFRGAMAHFRLCNHALAQPEINDLMISDKSAMAHYRETTLLKVDLYTVRDDDHKPLLYIEADNKGEPLEVSLTNPGDKPVAFKSFSAPSADNFHVQLRFRRNVIAPGVLRALQAPTGGVVIDGWQHAAGTAANGREDYISFVKTAAPFTLDKGQAWRIQIPNFSAAAQGGARNTRVQVRYRTEPQDPGSVVRHMEVQSHLGVKTVPLIARFRDSNTLLNNGQEANQLTIEVVYTSDTGSVRLDDASKFELIVDNDLVTSPNLAAVSRVDWIEAQKPSNGIAHTEIAFQVKRPPVSQAGADTAPALLEISRGQPLTFDLANWVTDKPSGMYNIVLRYENIPGFWDGAWVLPVQLSPLVLRSDKIGIGTDEPGADLEIRRDVQGAVGPVLRLTNGEGGQNSGAAIDFNVGPAGQGAAHDPTFRIEGRITERKHPDGRVEERTDLLFVGSATEDKDSPLEEKARITAEGRIKDRMGDIMPVGAILPYGGRTRPDGWLYCDGAEISRNDYPDLYDTLQDPERPNDAVRVPDLRSRFIIGAGKGSGNDARGDPLTEYKPNDTGGEAKHMSTIDEMPAHNHGINPDGYLNITEINLHYDGSPSWGGKDTKVLAKGESDAGPYSNFIRPEGGKKSSASEWKGTVQSHNNMPPYYALTYIIKY